jgi:hypothetical protein
MKTLIHPLVLTLLLISTFSFGQEKDQQQYNDEEREYRDGKPYRNRRHGRDDGHYIKTIFNNNGPRSSGGYVSMSNKLTAINGDYANMVELYGGWYIGHRFLIGIGGAATTNNLRVASQFSVNPKQNIPMSYEYAQAGLMTEYVIASDRAIHVAFQLFAGAGFTTQYERYGWEHDAYWDNYSNYDHDNNFFAVAEPGIKVEVNIFRWLRFSPGISYRLAYGSNGIGLPDSKIEGTSVNMALKIGKF